MKLIAPDYYGEFRCVAGACRHSCCVGWEIDVDPDSQTRFEALPGAFGERVRQSIERGGGEAYFRMGGDGRCPFLNDAGLCDMIIELGEDSLCQICADHPRFRNFFSDREYVGLGLCCEAAAELILGRDAPSRQVLLADDGGNELPDDDEMEIIGLMDDVTEFFQDRSVAMPEKVARMLAEMEMPEEPDWMEWADFLDGLERMDESWHDELERLKGSAPSQSMTSFERPFEQLMTYLIYRHLPPAIDDGSLDGRMAFCLRMWQTIYRMCAAHDDPDINLIADICRLFSSEIEYSDENIVKILEHIET